MKILFAHNFYQLSGGEDVVVASEIELLRRFGHDVELYSVSNDTIKGLRSKFVTAISSAYSSKSCLLFKEKLRTYCPDIVHVHNFFPLLTPSIYDACCDLNIPLVQTLHNYRTICCGAYLLRNGKVCEKCLDHSPYYGVLHRCYRNSFIASATLAHMISFHHYRKTWQTKIDAFISLTSFSKDVFIKAGFPASRIWVKPNFISGSQPIRQQAKREGALFVGRLSDEKGIITLLEAWKNIPYTLKIAGDGPLRTLVEENQGTHVRYLGSLKPSEVREEMASSAFLVMPSIWYEGFPMVLVESFACGLPVVVSKLGSMAEIVSDGINGLHFSPGDSSSLKEKVEWAVHNLDKLDAMGRNAFDTYTNKYTADINYKLLMNIYSTAINNRSCNV